MSAPRLPVPCALAWLAGTLGCNASQADTYPARPITLVVPYAAGGPMDMVARQLAAALKDQLNTAIVIENQGGAGGTIGTQRVIRARADGYTLLLQHVGLATAPALYPALRLDPRHQLTPIAVVSEVPMLIATAPSGKVTGMPALIRLSQAESLNWGTAGPGSASSLCTRLIGAAMRMPYAEIAYKGTGPASVDLMGGQVDVMCDLATNLKPLIDGGKLRALAAVSAARNPAFPAVPAIAESQLAVPDLSVWYGLFAPSGLPPTEQETLRRAAYATASHAKYRTSMQNMGAMVPASADATAEQLALRLDRDLARFGALSTGNR